MEKEKKTRHIQVKSLTELKRAIKPGVEMLTTSHAYHPDIVGLTRQVTKVQTVGFYSVIKNQLDHKYSACNYGKGFFTEFEKAPAYIFDGDTTTLLDTRKNDGSILMTFELYEREQKQIVESEEKNMNEWERMRRMAQGTKEAYPVGTRLELISMDDPYAPVPSGTRGTVQYVDDMGQIGMKWDNGRSLSLIPGEDSFRKLTQEELVEEKNAKMPHIKGTLVALTPDECESFMGYTTDQKWNGWECPWFPKSSVDKIMAHINSEGGNMAYDAEQDSYTVTYSSDRDEKETFTGADCIVNGTIEHLYPIGSHSWIWDKVEPEQNEDMDEDNSPVMGM